MKKFQHWKTSQKENGVAKRVKEAKWRIVLLVQPYYIKRPGKKYSYSKINMKNLNTYVKRRPTRRKK